MYSVFFSWCRKVPELVYVPTRWIPFEETTIDVFPFVPLPSTPPTLSGFKHRPPFFFHLFFSPVLLSPPSSLLWPYSPDANTSLRPPSLLHSCVIGFDLFSSAEMFWSEPNTTPPGVPSGFLRSPVEADFQHFLSCFCRLKQNVWNETKAKVNKSHKPQVIALYIRFSDSLLKSVRGNFIPVPETLH